MSIKGHLQQKVTIEKPTTDPVSYDGNGAPIRSPGVTTPARVIEKATKLITRDGTEVNSSAHIWLETDESLTPEARITLPDGTAPAIKQIQHPRDDYGPRYTVVYI